MSAAASYILAFTFIFLPSVSSLNKGETKTTHEIAYGSVVDYSIVKISYPFMARIIMDGIIRCGGALISADRFVATARHCLEFCPCFDEANPSNDWTRCRTCILKLRENSDYISDTETVHMIKTIYLPQNSGSPYDKTDFALVELASSANSCTKEETVQGRCWKVSPVSLPDPYLHIKEGQRVRTLGWGATELSFDDDQSEFLAQLDITINSSTLFHYLLETNVGPNGADPCRGDSGGPLLLRGEDLEWTLVGTLVGGGYECGNPDGIDSTSDWSKVALLVPWINSVMGCPSGWSLYESSCYRFYHLSVDISWIKAQAECQKKHSSLASVTNVGIQTFIGGLQGIHHAWIGGFRPAGSNPNVGWEWLDKSVWSYENWQENNVNGKTEPNGETELCLVQYRSGLGNAWNDASCSSTEDYGGYVCEKHWTAAKKVDTRVLF